MGSRIGQAAALVGVIAVAGAFAAGSQMIRQASGHSRTADAIASPSPSPTPSCEFASDTTCPSPTPPCVQGEGVECPGPISVGPPTPAPAAPAPTDEPANSRPPAGQIEASATYFIIPGSPGSGGGKIGLMVAVLFDSGWVSGASVSAQCTGPGLDVSASGATAPRAAWAPTVNPSIPTGPNAFFWAVLTGTIQEGGAKYVCHGTATYNGLTTSF